MVEITFYLHFHDENDDIIEVAASSMMSFPLAVDEVVVYVIFETNECDNVASYYPDVRIY